MMEDPNNETMLATVQRSYTRMMTGRGEYRRTDDVRLDRYSPVVAQALAEARRKVYAPITAGLGGIQIQQNELAALIATQDTITVIDFTQQNITMIGQKAANLIRRFSGRATQAINPDVVELVGVAAMIYINLHINAPGSKAIFKVEFMTDREYVAGIVRQEFDTDYLLDIQVILSQMPLVQESMVLSIAVSISRIFHQWTVKYGKSRTRFDVQRLVVKQILSPVHYQFMHVIRGGLPFMFVFNQAHVSHDVVLASEMRALKKALNEKNAWLASPNTKKHCIPTAIWMALHQKHPSELTDNERSQMKVYSCNFAKKTGISNLTLEEAVSKMQDRTNYRNLRVNIMDRCFNMTHRVEYITNMKKEVWLVVFADHAYAVIFHPDPAMYVKEEERLICKTEKEIHNVSLGFADFETTSDTVKPYAAAIKFNTTQVVTFTGSECVAEMLSHIRSKMTRGKTSMIGFHNGGKFDFFFLMGVLFQSPEWRVDSILEFNGRVWLIRCLTQTYSMPNTVTFFDTIGILPMSLNAVGLSYCTEHHKQKALDYEAIRSDTWERLFTEEHQNYIREDVLTLEEGFKKAISIYEELFDFPMLGNHYTLSGAAQAYWLSKYYDIGRRPMYTLSEKNSELAEAAYFGGSCECSFRGEILSNDPANRVYELGTLMYTGTQGKYYNTGTHAQILLNEHMILKDRDIKAMYPWIMANRRMPYGPAEYITFADLPEDFFGVVECEVRGGASEHANILRVKSPIGVIAPRFQSWYRGVWTSIDIRLAMKFCDYEYRFIGGFKTESDILFRESVMDLFNYRQRFPKGSAQYSAAKIALCSLYGAWGIKEKGNGIVIRPTEQRLAALFHTQSLIALTPHLAYTEKRVESNARNVHVAACVTSWAYDRLMSSMIRSMNAEVYTVYRDTDSLYQISTEEQPDYRDRNEEIGYFCPEVTGIISGVFVAKKVYAIRYKVGDEVREKVTIKGVPHEKEFKREETEGGVRFVMKSLVPDGTPVQKIGYDDVRGLLLGRKITIVMPRFMGGLKGWCDQSDMPRLRKMTAEITLDGELHGLRVLRNGWTEPLTWDRGEIT